MFFSGVPLLSLQSSECGNLISGSSAFSKTSLNIWKFLVHVMLKSKGEKERYTHLNAEFQRIARRDKKAFLSGGCKETEENNRMGKTRDLKKIKATKGTFHANTSTIKDI